MSKDQKQIALFDFDGTLTNSDSLWHFLWFSVSPGKLLIGTIKFLPTYIKYLLKTSNNSKAKEKLFSIFFSGTSLTQFNKTCLDFSQKVIPKLIRTEAFEKLKWHQEQGHEVAIVSASFSNYLKPYFEDRDVMVIATEPEVSEGVLTGNFSTPNCYGPEKCARISKLFNTDQYNQIYVYGDSEGDKEMLALGTKQFYRKFN